MAELEASYHISAAQFLPAPILFGTSSWTYPGWKGTVYTGKYRSDKEFTSTSFAEYLRFPWFRTVGIDSSFYGPPKKDALLRYASQAPPDFRWVSKVWEQITIPAYARHKRYGAQAGKDNPDFLNAELFSNQIASLFEDSAIKPHTGPFVFQFQRMAGVYGREPGRFFEKLNYFLGALPKTFLYATEIRNREFLVPAYFDVLNRHGVTHCFNHWSFMPPLKEQMECAARAGGLHAPFYVARILTPLGVQYEAAVKLFSPYDEIKRPNPAMRIDVVRLAKRALERNVPAFILVNNRSEGHAPKTIADIGKMIIDSLSLEN